jgi:glycosyltransferase involved in cell wall biosynthesis
MSKVAFGIVSCNRLFYLKSCLESLLDTTRDFSDKEVVVVDNASVEAGTAEYLESIEKRGMRVIRVEHRDPPNEYARGLNTITAATDSEYLCLLQGDMQFVLPGWLRDMLDFYSMNDDVVGSIMLDAQRKTTHASHDIRAFPEDRQPRSFRNRFFADLSRDPISPAADVMFKRSILEKVLPWSERNLNHEGGMDSENEMRYRVRGMLKEGRLSPYVMALSAVPQAVAIYTDPRGTQGRVRGNKRFGRYWQAKDPDGWKYYDYIEEADCDLRYPQSIETVARPIGFEKYLGSDGVWLKNPIRPETATPDDWEELA